MKTTGLTLAEAAEYWSAGRCKGIKIAIKNEPELHVYTMGVPGVSVRQALSSDWELIDPIVKKETRTVNVWVNVYPDYVAVHQEELIAQDMKMERAIAVAVPVEFVVVYEVED